MKKLLAMLLTGVMLLGLVACGATEEAPAEAETPAATEEAPAEEAESAEEAVIHYWAQWSENEVQAEVLKAAIARFEEKNPGVTVEVNWAGREVREILRTSIDSGTQIDIVESGYDQIVSNLGEEYLMDITQYMEGSDFEAAISDSMVAFSKSFVSDGESWYYIPAQPFVGTIYYNAAIFEEAGIEAQPTNWAEFMDVCQKIKDAGYDPLTIDDAYLPTLYGTYLASAKGVEWFTELMTTKDATLWDDPMILQMAKDYAALSENGYFAASTGSNVFPAAQNGELALGTAAMYYNGSWLPNEVASITGDDFQWGAMFFPAPEGSVYPYTTYTTGCQFYGVTKGCEHPELAVALLEEFTSVETQQALADEAQCVPVIDGIELPANLACVGELTAASTDAFVWQGATATDTEIQAIVNAEFTKLIAGDIGAEEFVQNVKDQI